MMVLEYETRRRNNAIRQLYWDDIDQEDWVVTWRGETDKIGKELVVPLTERAIEVLKGLPFASKRGTRRSRRSVRYCGTTVSH